VKDRAAGITVKRSFICLLLAAAGCGGSDLVLPGSESPAESASPVDIDIIQGNRQSGTPGSILGDSILVRVTDSAGTAVPGRQVEFVSPAPGASVTPQIGVTDADGIAGARWVLGFPSGTQVVVARVLENGAPSGLQATFEASVDPDEAARIELLSGDDQTGPVGTALPEPLVVRVTDQFGNPVPDASIVWRALHGSVDPNSSQTGSDGRAETSWVLGSSTGPQRATASAQGLDGSPITFTSTAVPGSANGLVRVAGNGQSGGVGEELDEPLVVRLVDQEGNGIPAQAVTWVVGVGGGSAASTTTLTDEDGEARTRWTLGPSPGTNTINAVVSGVGIVAFTATAVGASTPTRMRFVVHPTDVPHKHGIISPPVVVEILDQSGNRVTDREVTIRLDLIAIRTGRSMGHEQARTVDGVATYPDLHINVVGEFLLRATAPGLPPVDSEHFVTHE
jgi:hypothetical protein